MSRPLHLPITQPDHLDAAWLTEVLLLSGALRRGQVSSVELEVANSNWSSSVWLRPEYASDSEGERPRALLLKICADPQQSFGPSEYHYYTRDYRDHPAAPLVRCYHAAYCEAPRSYHLLLEDLRVSHGDGFAVSPTLELALASADALARLHAPYWGSERLAALGTELASDADLERYFAHVGPGLTPLLDALGDTLPLQQRRLLCALHEEHPRLARERARDPRAFTLVHGDLNPGNVLWPRVGAGPVYLIDRQPFDWSLRVWFGASDLGRLMIVPWLPEQRRSWQGAVLRQYQESLARHGIELPWQQLLADYRLAALESVQIAVEWCADPQTLVTRRSLWQWQLERALIAVQDLDCRSLLGGALDG